MPQKYLRAGPATKDRCSSVEERSKRTVRRTSGARLSGLARVIAVLALVLVVLPARATRADPGPVSVQSAPATEVCASCHQKEYNDWQGSPHANSSLTPERHKDWGEGPAPDYCRFCHPQGIDAAGGSVATTGVTCTSCHGAYTDDHPPAIMPIRRTTEFCAACHTATYHEWQSSGHGREGIACVSCHAVHSQTTRGTQSKYLCISCHAERFHDFLGTAHGKADVSCVQCHLGTGPNDVAGIKTSSRVSPSHTFVARVEICLDCHRDSIHDQRTAAESGTTPAAQTAQSTAQPRPTAAVTLAAGSQASQAGTLDLTWAGGALAGLVLGFAVAWVTIRGRSL